MTAPHTVSTGRLVWGLAVWLPVCYAAWYLAAPVLVAPAVILARLGLALTLPGVVEHLRWAQTTVQVYTTLPADTGQYGFALEALAYGYGMPLLGALLLATGGPSRLTKLAVGLAILMPFIAWGLYFAIVRSLLTTHGQQLVADPARLAWLTELVQLGARLGLLVFTPLVPVLLWVWLQRERLRSLVSAPGG